MYIFRDIKGYSIFFSILGNQYLSLKQLPFEITSISRVEVNFLLVAIVLVVDIGLEKYLVQKIKRENF